MVSTTFTRETQLRVDLPQAVTGEQVPADRPEQIEVVISAEGSIAVNQQTLADPNLKNLMRALERESAGNLDLPVVITADALTPHQSVITAMDAAGKLGFSRLRLTTAELPEDAAE